MSAASLTHQIREQWPLSVEQSTPVRSMAVFSARTLAVAVASNPLHQRLWGSVPRIALARLPYPLVQGLGAGRRRLGTTPCAPRTVVPPIRAQGRRRQRWCPAGGRQERCPRWRQWEHQRLRRLGRLANPLWVLHVHQQPAACSAARTENWLPPSDARGDCPTSSWRQGCQTGRHPHEAVTLWEATETTALGMLAAPPTDAAATPTRDDCVDRNAASVRTVGDVTASETTTAAATRQ